MAANPPTTVLVGDVANPPHNFTHPQPFIRSPYNYDAKAASDAVGIVNTAPSLTVQSMSEDADLNVMLKRFGVTGKMPEVVNLPSYGDFSGITDFRGALEAVMTAQENFMELPADVRAKFENNPQLMLDFVENPANISEVKQIFGEKNVPAVVRDNAPAPAAAGAPVGTPAASGSGAAGEAK